MQTNPAKELRLTQFVASLINIDVHSPGNPLGEVVTHLNALLTDMNACVKEFNGLFNARNSKINTH
jgi:hypothetical protein